MSSSAKQMMSMLRARGSSVGDTMPCMMLVEVGKFEKLAVAGAKIRTGYERGNNCVNATESGSMGNAGTAAVTGCTTAVCSLDCLGGSSCSLCAGGTDDTDDIDDTDDAYGVDSVDSVDGVDGVDGVDSKGKVGEVELRGAAGKCNTHEPADSVSLTRASVSGTC